MRTPEQILNSVYKKHEYEKGRLLSGEFIKDLQGPVLSAMQEHAIEFAEWINREEVKNNLAGFEEYGWYYERAVPDGPGVTEEFDVKGGKKRRLLNDDLILLQQRKKLAVQRFNTLRNLLLGLQES